MASTSPSTPEEYATLVQQIRNSSTFVEGGKSKPTRAQQAHLDLVNALEERLPGIESHYEVTQISSAFHCAFPDESGHTLQRIDALKRARQIQKEQQVREAPSLVEEVQTEIVQTASGGRSNSSASERKPTESPVKTEADADSGSPPANRQPIQTKTRPSLSKKGSSKKRKRESSPADSIRQADEVPEESGNPPKPNEVSVKVPTTPKAGKRKSARKGESPLEPTPVVDEPASEVSSPTKAGARPNGTTKGKSQKGQDKPEEDSKSSTTVEDASEVEAEQFQPPGGRRRSARQSVARASYAPPIDAADTNTPAHPAASSGAKKSMTSRPAGSRRSKRLAHADEEEVDDDVDMDLIVEETLAQRSATRRVINKRTARGEARSLWKFDDASTLGDDDVKMDVDAASSTDVAASPADVGTRKKLSHSESGDTTPVNPQDSTVTISDVAKAGPTENQRPRRSRGRLVSAVGAN